MRNSFTRVVSSFQSCALTVNKFHRSLRSAGSIWNLSVSQATDYEVFRRKIGCETLRMYLNEIDENRQFKTSAARVTWDRSCRMSLISLRSSLEEKIEDNEIWDIKTNLRESSDFKPNRISTFITGRKKTNFCTILSNNL